MPMTTVLKARKICFTYDGQQAINNVSLDLEHGTLTALVGPNGAGKSTLLHLLQGRLKRNSGSVACTQSIALMPQRAAIDWNFPITVRDMVGLSRTSIRGKNVHLSTNQVLERVGMGGLGSRRLNQLSGGQQQRMLLARAIRQETGVLLLDEPCSAIDPPTRNHLLKVMREQAESGQCLLVSSHDWGSALDSYDKVIVLDGNVLACGTPQDVREKLQDLTCMMGSTCCE